MKRKLLIPVLCLTMMFSSISAVWAAAFTDTESGELAMAAAVLQGMDVVAGTSATTFDPQGTLTRAQACTMLVKMMGLDSNLSSGAKKTYFSDVPAGAWYAAYVNLAYSNGLINGYGNGKFGPDDYISYGQLATIILRMLGYTTADIGKVWPADYTAMSEDLGISADFTVGDNARLNRGQAALMLYRSLTCMTKDGRREYYETIKDVAFAKEAIIMSVSAEKNGSTGLLLGYGQGQQAGEICITQAHQQSEIFEGYWGKILLNSAGKAVGFLPEDTEYKDLTLEEAGISYLKAGGTKYRMSSTVPVLDSEGENSWGSRGYVKTAGKKGETVRLFLDNDGAVKYVYLFSSPQSSENSNASFEYVVSGYITSVSPSLVAAEKVTVAGNTFEVSECAASSFSDYRIGDKVSLCLGSDLKVCDVNKEYIYDKMLGVLASDGKSVTLAGSGIKLSASTMKYSDKLAGGLVRVIETSRGTLTCTEVESSQVTGSIDLDTMTVGGSHISPACEIYEWTGSGFVCSLDGVRGEVSYDLDAIDWTHEIPASQVSWCHADDAGEVDLILLNDVTGNCYNYGYLDIYEDNEGIDLGSIMMHAYNRAGVLTNGSGSGQKSLCVITDKEAFCGAAYGLSNKNSTIVSVKELKSFRITSANALSLEQQKDGEEAWFADDGNTKYQISENLQVYNQASESWSKEIGHVLGFLESGYTVSLYYDRTPDNGGRVRIAVINK